MVLRKSKPIIAAASLPNKALSTGEKVLYRWTITADQKGDISWQDITFEVSGSIQVGGEKFFIGSKTEIRIKGKKMLSAYSQLCESLYQTVVHLQLFPQNPSSIRIFYGVIAALAMSSANLFLLVVALIFGMAMPKKTALGVDTANMVKSLRNFLISQDRQLAFQAQKQLLFEKLLPYAIVFGVEKIWAKRFAEFDLKTPDWYESQTGTRFNTLVLANSLGRSFNTMTSSMTTTSSSSGFSSGFSGGSSGGGGGGGGGGSW